VAEAGVTALHPPTQPTPSSGGAGWRARGAAVLGVAAGIRELTVLVVGLLIGIYFTVTNPNFLTGDNFQTICTYVAATAIVASGEVLLLIQGDIDLSVAVVAVGVPFLTYGFDQLGLPLAAGMILSLLVAALIGAINGVVRVYFNVPSLIGTLGTFLVVNGLILVVFNAQPQAPPGSSTVQTILGRGNYAEILWAVGIVIVMQLLLTTTRWGLHTNATGGNITGAREAGINVNLVRLRNFVLCSVLAGFAGILEGMRTDSLQPPHRDTDLMFFAVAGAVIGGTALSGGSGSVVGAFLGVAIIKVLFDGLTLGGTNAFAFDAIVGTAIIVAMVLNQWIARVRQGARG